MLILHRRRSEALLIGDDIRVVVLDSTGGGTRLGIEAPGHVSILREEILTEITEENARATAQASFLEGWNDRRDAEPETSVPDEEA